ncbi:MAG: hypothetical protein IT320_03005 [Anaerolineae bacterium]|nr:hypothetical protein [Anaerolineae bacterium]
MNRFRNRALGIGLGALLLMSATLAWAQEDDGMADMPDGEMVALIHDVRIATTQYHDLDTALDGGYGKFLECFRHGEDMGMGQHYVNGDLLGDDVLDPLKPEALVYEPLGDGAMTLVAFEYIVPAAVWDPNDTGREAPTLFGQTFSLKTNIPDTPPIWALHIWLWTHNPAGMFADYNPLVVCPSDAPSVDMAAQ